LKPNICCGVECSTYIVYGVLAKLPVTWTFMINWSARNGAAATHGIAIIRSARRHGRLRSPRIVATPIGAAQAIASTGRVMAAQPPIAPSTASHAGWRVRRQCSHAHTIASPSSSMFVCDITISDR
jgi:hypothetical protein